MAAVFRGGSVGVVLSYPPCTWVLTILHHVWQRDGLAIDLVEGSTGSRADFI